MKMTTTSVSGIPAIDHDEAMHLASTEYDRFLDVVSGLGDDDWSRQTDCAGWDVQALLGHVLGMLELLGDPAEAGRQRTIAAERAKQSGVVLLHELTALQVREHADLTTAELSGKFPDATRRALASRQATTAEQRRAPYVTGLPGEAAWSIGYLLDVIHTRDPWLHRIDIIRATGRDAALDAAHDGRIVADVVADWAGRHRQPFALVLTGPAGGSYRVGVDGPDLELDAVEFCRILSGRAHGTGLLATSVAF